MAAEIRNLREAMALLLAKINESAGENGTMSTDDIIRASFIRRMLKKFPLRNCDVGTAEEQKERFDAFCRRYRMCHGCPHENLHGDIPEVRDRPLCALAWAQMPPYEQMPYEAQEGAGE